MEVYDIKSRINFELVKKIFSNANNAKKFLTYFNVNAKGHSSRDMFNEIVKIWDYDKALPVIRDIFKASSKFSRGSKGADNLEILLNEWHNLNLGNISWPFSQRAFDNFVQSINAENIQRSQKDEKVKNAAIKYRRIKEINTERNDFIENLIFLKRL